MRNDMSKRFTLGGIALIAMGVVFSGCGGGEQAPPAGSAPVVTSTAGGTAGTTGATGTASAAPPYKFRVKTGAPVSIGDATLVTKEIASRTFHPRPDPFALLPVERNFDQAQVAEKLSQEMGYSTMYEPPVETTTEDVFETQPYRRLAGVLVGDTVSAILIMEDGTAVLIKPGMRIPNSPWRVVSIDEDKAVLRRAGHVRPTQITVPLETPPGGTPANQGVGRPGGGGGPARGGPTGPAGSQGPRGNRGGGGPGDAG